MIESILRGVFNAPSKPAPTCNNPAHNQAGSKSSSNSGNGGGNKK